MLEERQSSIRQQQRRDKKQLFFSHRLTNQKQATALKSIKSLAPLLDRVLVQRIKAETRTASGIFLPESSVKELNEARVLAVGPGGLDKDGKRVSCGVSVGDKVLIPQVSLLLCFFSLVVFRGTRWREEED
jgi:chaperonin GroES